MTVAIIDYGMGNLRSVARALQYVGADEVIVTDDLSKLHSADRLVFPGQGAMGSCFSHIKAHGLREELPQLLKSRPVLGICLGLQAVLDFSEEDGGVAGLGLIAGQVRRFPEQMSDGGTVAKIPQMGWNTVQQSHSHPLWRNIPDNAWFYFVHSYYAQTDELAALSGMCRYGDIEFAAAAQQDNIFAVQFHPEKSHRDGLQLLKNFLSWDGA